MSERAMLSDPATQDERYPFPVHYGRLLAVDGFLKDYQSAAVDEARRILAVAEEDGVHHDILPGLLRYDLQPMRDLCDALSAFLAAPDPVAYLAGARS